MQTQKEKNWLYIWGLTILSLNLPLTIFIHYKPRIAVAILDL